MNSSGFEREMAVGCYMAVQYKQPIQLKLRTSWNRFLSSVAKTVFDKAKYKDA